MTTGILNAAGGLGLFLLGMVVMSRGLRKLSGDALRRTLARFTASPYSGAVTGATVTALIQSSSATTVMAVGLVSSGLLSFSQALGIIFGANIGTTITGWFVAIVGFKLKLGELAFPLILIGVLMHLLTKRRTSQIGLALAGFGLVFVGIEGLQNGLAGLEGVITPEIFPDDTLVGRLLLVCIGITITLVTQSSSAGVATALAAVNANAITFPQAAAMVIGMDVGTTATAAIATIGASIDGRRTGFAHVFYNLLTAIGAFFLLGGYTWTCNTIAPQWLENNPEIALVGFHTLFNTIGVVAIVPFTGAFAKLVVRIVPDRPPLLTKRLDPAIYETPTLAIEAARATLRDLIAIVTEQLVASLNLKAAEIDQERLDEAKEALEQTRNYLEPIDTSAEADVLYPRHTSSIHLIDHLRRLIDRCEEAPQHDKVAGNDSIEMLRCELLAAVNAKKDRQRQEDSKLAETTLQAMSEKLESRSQNLRSEIVEEAAKGEIDADLAIRQLDYVRWLRRVAYHAWRIEHHLRRSKLDRDVVETEEIQPHRELEIRD